MTEPHYPHVEKVQNVDPLSDVKIDIGKLMDSPADNVSQYREFPGFATMADIFLETNYAIIASFP